MTVKGYVAFLAVDFPMDGRDLRWGRGRAARAAGTGAPRWLAMVGDEKLTGTARAAAMEHQITNRLQTIAQGVREKQGESIPGI